MIKLWTFDLLDSLKFGSVMPIRWMLAMASLVYAGFTAVSPDLPFTTGPQNVGSLVLSSGWRWEWALLFLFHSSLLWWRIFDEKPRPKTAAVINVFTLGLWLSVLVATAVTTDFFSPGLTGYVIFTMMAAQVVWRTEYTLRDRSTA